MLAPISRIAVLPVLAAGALALAQPAFGNDYCVAPNASCGAGNVQTFQTALDDAAANSGPDRIFLGAATYTAPSQGFIYDPLGNADPIEIAGEGNQATILKGTSGAYRTLAVFGGAGTSVHDLGVVMPPSAPDDAQAVRTNGIVNRVMVNDDATESVTARTGVFFTGAGTLEDSDISLKKVPGTTAVELAQGSVVQNSSLYAGAGVRSNGGTIDRTYIDADGAGVELNKGATKVRSTVVETYGYGSVGIGGEATTADTSVEVDGVNIIGPDGTQGTAISVGNVYAPSAKVDVTVKNSIIRGYPSSFWLESGGPGYVHANVSYSDYAPATTANGPTAQLNESHISYVGNTGFGGEAYAPVAGSPLIDAGDPNTTQGLDVNGNALVTDGDGDGVARRDIGAYELPTQPLKPVPAGATPAGSGDQPPAAPPVVGARDTLAPALSGLQMSHKVFAVGHARTAIAARTARGTRLSYTLSENANVVVRVQRIGSTRVAGTLTRTAKSGRNTIAFSGRIGAKALKAGRYRAVITATDAAGNRSKAQSVSFRIVRR